MTKMKEIKTGINLVEDFKQYNGFYKIPGMREIVYNLYKGECQCCGKNISLISDMDVGHRFPQSHADIFSQYFPELDIHNLLNLQPEHSSCNRGKRNNYILNPNLLQSSMDYSARIIIARLPKIFSQKTKTNSHNVNMVKKRNVPDLLLANEYFFCDGLKWWVKAGVFKTMEQAKMFFHRHPMEIPEENNLLGEKQYIKVIYNRGKRKAVDKVAYIKVDESKTIEQQIEEFQDFMEGEAIICRVDFSDKTHEEELNKSVDNIEVKPPF